MGTRRPYGLGAVLLVAAVTAACQRERPIEKESTDKPPALTVHHLGTTSADAPVVVLLHGFGASGNDLVPLGEALIDALASVHVVVVEAPIDLGSGRRAWWRDPMTPLGAEAARKGVTAIVEELVAKGTSPENIAVAGFSQGAVLAMDVALHFPKKLAGAALLSGYSVLESRWSEQLAKRSALAVFMSHGDRDSLTEFRWAQQFAARLRELGYTVSLVTFAGGHTISREAYEGLVAFLRQQLFSAAAVP